MTVAARPLRILMVWELGANLGHLYRLLPLATLLQQRGHTVVIVVPDPALARQRAVDTRLEFVECPKLNLDDDQSAISTLPSPKSSYAEILQRYAFGDDRRLTAALQAWTTLVDTWRPDALLIEFAPLALLTARLHRLPAVHVAIGWEAPPEAETLPVLLRCGASSAPVLETAMVKRINRHCALAGVPGLRRLSDIYRSATQLLATLPELDHFGPRVRGQYIGPLFATQIGPVVQWPMQRPDEHPPKVFVYLQPDKANLAVIRALKSLHAQVIAVLPEVRPEAIEQLQDDRTQIFSHPVRLTQLFDGASLIISNAGHGIAAAGLLTGVPQLLIPRNLEQHLFAQRVAATGAARVLPIEQLNARVADAITNLLNNAEARQAASAQALANAAFTQEHVLTTVVDALETAKFALEDECVLTECV